MTLTEEVVTENDTHSEHQPSATPEVLIRKFLEETLDNGVKPDRIGVYPVGNDFYRVNVWAKEMTEECVVPLISLPCSYYVEITPGGKVVDRTIRKDRD